MRRVSGQFLQPVSRLSSVIRGRGVSGGAAVASGARACVIGMLAGVAVIAALPGWAVGATPGRAYEMVSPLDKNGGDVDRDLLQALNRQSGAAVSGEAVAWASRLQIGDIESGSLFPNYLSRRGPQGWTTEGISPPIGNLKPGTELPRVSGLSSDLTKAFVTAPLPLTADAPLLSGSWGLYMRSADEAERYRLLSTPWSVRPSDPGTTAAAARFEYVADVATSGSRHVVFNSRRQLLEDAPPDTPNSASNAVYEWVDGSVRLVSVLPSGLSLAGEAVAGDSTALQSGFLPGDHLISDDGRRVFFRAVATDSGGTAVGPQLFVRESGAGTRVVSASERAGDPPTNIDANPSFWAAKASDGSVAFFLATDPLTEGAGMGSLYRWDANAPEGGRLTELSRDLAGEPGVLGPAAVSDDATIVYFVAQGVLAEGAIRGEHNLYRWKQGEGVRFIAALAGTADLGMWDLRWLQGGRAARVSADGERLLFASYAQLDPSYDTTETTPEACGDPAVAGERCRQIYVYDGRRDAISCVTCVPGVPVSGDANVFGNGDVRDAAKKKVDAPLRLPRNLSADGTRAFFETARRLAPADNNSALDVYEWHDADLDGQGELHLVSTGRGLQDSKFLDASASGSDVFFTTGDRLVGIDIDNQVDLYDARVGGGIAAQNPPPPPPPCAGDACQGVPAGPPLLAGVGTVAQGLGNLHPGPRAAFSVRRLSRAQRARLARGRRVALRVRVNRPGKVSVVARAKLGKRSRTIARGSKWAREAGIVRVSVRLSRPARRRLARTRKLGVRFSVRFAGVSQAGTARVKLRRARSSTGRSGR